MCIVLVLLLHYIYSIHAWLMDHVDSKNIWIFQMEKTNTGSSRTVISLEEEEYWNVQLPSIQYHIQHWRNIQTFSYLQYSTTYSNERISKCSVIFNRVPCTALKEYPNVQLPSIQYHIQHWRNIQRFSYLQYSTTYSTEGISKHSVIFNTVPRTALKEYPNVQLSSIQYHIQHWRNIQMFSYLQYGTT